VDPRLSTHQPPDYNLASMKLGLHAREISAHGIVCAIPALVSLTVITISSPVWIKNIAIDDSLYYPIIARNIATGLGSTYDGITQTNGYQPLWCWLQVPIAKLFGSLEPMNYLWFIKLSMALVVATALATWGLLIRRVSGSMWMSFTFVVLLGSSWWSVNTLYGGMETPLVVLLIGICLLLLQALADNNTTKTALSLGMAMAATFLARLDSIFFLAVLGCTTLGVLGRQVRLNIAWITPVLLLPMPYLWWNFATFGSIVPVSGLRKSIFSPELAVQAEIVAGLATDKISKLTALLNPAGTLLLFLVTATGMWISRFYLRQQLGQLKILWILPISAALHFTYIATFMTEADVSWYHYCQYLTLFLLLSLVVSAATSWIHDHQGGRTFDWIPLAIVCIGLLAVLSLYAPRKLPDQYNSRSYETAVWAKGNLGPGNLLFGMADSGVFRFVSGFNTIALNGLAGDQEILSLTMQRNRTEILRRYNVNYVVSFVAEDDIDKIPSGSVVFRSERFTFGELPGRLLIVAASHWTECGTCWWPTYIRSEPVA
jgi:hypothetical protein